MNRTRQTPAAIILDPHGFLRSFGHWIAVAAFAMGLAGCAANTHPEPAAPILLDVGPQDLESPLSYGSVVSGTFDGKDWTMRVEVEATADKLVVVGLSTMGATLFVIEQGRDRAAEVSLLMPRWPGPDPRYMLFDLYVSKWPVKALRPALAAQGLRIEVQSPDSRRIIKQSGGEDVATVTYLSAGKDVAGEGGLVVIKHFDLPYEIRVRPFVTGQKS